jgi:hypothetical protein
MILGDGGGKILNVTLSAHHGLPGMANSSAARAAVAFATEPFGTQEPLAEERRPSR